MRNDLIERVDNGLYQVRVEMAQYYARTIPHPAGRRVYSNQWIKETLPDWRTAEHRYRQWLSVVMSISQGTIPPIADFAQFPVVYIRTPHGPCVPTAQVAGLHVIISKSLAHRTVVYCADVGPITLCSASREQLLHYLSPPCPDCAPFPPAPCGPKVDSLVADFKGRLIPLSDLPATARRYEPGVVFAGKSPVPYANDLFTVELSRRGGRPPHLRVVPREGFVRRYIGNDVWQFCQAVDALADYALAHLLSYYQALEAYGRSVTGLTAAGLMSRSEELFARAYEGRRRTPGLAPSLAPPTPYLRNVWYEERVGRRWQSKLLDKELGREWLTCEDIRAHLLRRASLGRVRVTHFELWLFLPDRDGTLSRDLAVEYDYLYHNERKDRQGTVRLEARPYGGVTSRLGPQDIMAHIYAKAHHIATALRVAMLTRHRTATALPLRQSQKFLNDLTE